MRICLPRLLQLFQTESAPVIPASQAFSSGANEQTSSTIAELENGLDTDGAPGAVFTITRTPFGTRTTAAFDLSASLCGSWTAASQVSLATARHEMTGKKN